MNNNHVYDMIVVGGGPGGYTAALYAARAGLDTVVLEKLSAGGQMALTEQIDNYPGFENGIDGFSLAENMQKQAERFGARSEYAEVLRMDLTAVPKLVETSEGIFRGKTVVLATGADPNVAENHQYHNAMVLANHKAAVVIEEKDLTGEKLVAAVKEMTADPEKLREIGLAAKALGVPNACGHITDELLDLYKTHRK